MKSWSVGWDNRRLTPLGCRTTYPTFQLGDELCLQGGRDVMVGVQYSHRAKQGKFPDGVPN
jgi:hypothetical protein